MHPILIALIIAASDLLLGLALWLFMIWPGGRRKEMLKYTDYHYAHRGLHDDTKAENSLSAFRAAKERGYGIELDVRLSKDGELVVHHDATLERVAGREGKVIDYTAEELAAMSLAGTSDGIPTFRQVLDLIDGTVPLIIEIKMGDGEKGVAEKLVEVLEGYDGPYVVESFNPIALKIVRKLRPDILRGILAHEYMKDERYKGKLVFRLGQNLELNFLGRPHFIAYLHKDYTVPKMRFVHRVWGTPLIGWTVRSQQEEDAATEHGFDAVIFENYIPEDRK